MTTTFRSLLISSLLLSLAPAQDVKHVMTTSCAGLPDGIKFPVKPMGYQDGIKLTFFLTHENMIEINEDSFKTDQKGWEIGPFAKVSDDGKTASFSIISEKNHFNKEADIKVNGSFTVKTGSNTQSKTFTLKKDADPVEINGMKISLSFKKLGFGGGKGVKVEGDFSSIKSIVVKQDGKTIKSNSSTWTKNMKTYSFKDLKEEAEVTLIWWTDLSQEVIEFKKD